ncbi:unnamed protein product [Clonostachys rosea f. rosea IK726]|uniref:Uncharacterized protein n=1 Tax=Clonostachys rosea f. rosea IK726 TaxID=1349383 RepID=A0ACA9TN75_BIOOC|nr:unnamed protein product [Clonostachys rosea f. rosea IK726]
MLTDQEDEKRLCAQCMSIFTGQQQLKDPSISSDRGPVHHSSAASFEAAANSGCVICTRARAALRKDELGFLLTQVGQEPFSYRLLSKNSSKLYTYTLEIIIYYYAVERSLGGDHGLERFVWETHLFSTEESIKEDYATLSHCWGGQSIIKLTTDALAQFQKKIETASLPQTFRDAILVARRLGIRYLWIDSLCIIQDSLQDWQKEAALMGEVYSNSTLNVMATACRNSH